MLFLTLYSIIQFCPSSFFALLYPYDGIQSLTTSSQTTRRFCFFWIPEIELFLPNTIQMYEYIKLWAVLNTQECQVSEKFLSQPNSIKMDLTCPISNLAYCWHQVATWTTHSHVSSSCHKSYFSNLGFVSVLLLPFSLAYLSHFVIGLGLGTGFSRGSLNVGGGSSATMASSTRLVGSCHIAFSKIWKSKRKIE